MPYILSYTKNGIGTYDETNYPGQSKAYNCDWEHAMHLAISDDGVHYTPLRNNTGILFAEATFTEGKPQGNTKTLLYPWIFRMKDGSFGICAVRRGQNGPDMLTRGCMMLFTSKDLVHYKEELFLRLEGAGSDIRHPACRYVPERDEYYVEWETDEGIFGGYTRYFKEIKKVERKKETSFIPESAIEVTEEEARTIRGYLGVIYNTSVTVPQLEVKAQKAEKPVKFEELPKAVCHYSDGSVHEKMVAWNRGAFDMIDFSAPGEYEVSGEVISKKWPFPIPLSAFPGQEGSRHQGIMSDPCVTEHNGRYYLTSSGGSGIILRTADTIEGVFDAPPIVIYEIPVGEDGIKAATWAAELHFIKDIPYLFTAICPGSWTRVKSCVLRCAGDPAVPENWEAPVFCLKPDKSLLTEGGISLDMTYFCDGGVHYVMWSDRKMPQPDANPVIAEPADIYIAVIDPDAPWQTVTQPQCIRRPIYGWDRYETEVVEGPYLLRRGDDLFVSISGSSTSMADLYDVGFLHAKSGSNLLCPDSWDWLTYPFLTKESVPGEYGPGHNNFVKDPETGDDLIVYHAVPHDANGNSLGRRPAIRRVHWSAAGLPYLEMTPDRDIADECRKVKLKIAVR